MREDSKELCKVVHIDEGRIKDHLDELVREIIGEKPNAMLEAETDTLYVAARYVRSWAGEVKNVSVLMVVGVGPDDFRRILGDCERHKVEPFWLN